MSNQITATAEQCMEALRQASKAANGGQYSTRDAGWFLLDIIKFKASKDDTYRVDSGYKKKEARVIRIWEDGLDYEAAFVLDAFIAMEKNARARGKRVKRDRVFSKSGIVRA